MKTPTYFKIIESLPLNDDREKLLQYDGSEILDEIMDYLEIQFPQWKEELGGWASEFIMHFIILYENIYYDAEEQEVYINCLSNIYLDIYDYYFQTVEQYKNRFEFARF